MGHKGQSQFWNVQKTPETVRFSSVVHGPSGTEPLLHCPEANKDRASSGLIMDRHVQSLFWEVQKPSGTERFSLVVHGPSGAEPLGSG